MPLRKSEPHDINKSQRCRKCAPLRIFFCKDVRWLAFSTDMGAGDAAILDPFASGIFAIFDVAVSFCS